MNLTDTTFHFNSPFHISKHFHICWLILISVYYFFKKIPYDNSTQWAGQVLSPPYYWRENRGNQTVISFHGRMRRSHLRTLVLWPTLFPLTPHSSPFPPGIGDWVDLAASCLHVACQRKENQQCLAQSDSKCGHWCTHLLVPTYSCGLG